MIVGTDKEKVIENIKEAVKNEEYNKKVELNDPSLSSIQKREIIYKYLKKNKKITYKLNNVVAKELVKALTWKENKEIKVVGMKNIKDITTGAIVTSNHFNPLDNLAIRKLSKKAGKKKLYIISQETNLAMGGVLGYVMNHSNLIPISNQISYMKSDFQKIIKEVLSKNNFILIYPEQEMWYNYKKPRTPKPGAYYYASKYDVPVISCFVEMIEQDEMESDEFKKVTYKLHVLKPIFPDKDKSDKENAAWMSERDYAQKIEAYEKAYGKKYTPEFEDDDIAGWVSKE